MPCKVESDKDIADMPAERAGRTWVQRCVHGQVLQGNRGGWDHGDRDCLGHTIQRFSIHDGPGIRTTVFLKGCGLRCFWCHNPESLDSRPQLQVFPERCIGCGRCTAVCPRGARGGASGEPAFCRESCTGCGKCVGVCPAGALVMIGRHMTSEEVIAEVLKDLPFYEESGGGVTLSGGEPLAQSRFAREILLGCREHGLHTAVETALFAPWESVAEVLPALDLVIMDVKVMDGERHKAVTGRDNGLILRNARRLGETGMPVIVRVPVVPGVNDTSDEIARIASFASQLPGLLYLELMPFHQFGEGKYADLGLDYKARGIAPPDAERMRILSDAARSGSVEVKCGAL